MTAGIGARGTGPDTELAGVAVSDGHRGAGRVVSPIMVGRGDELAAAVAAARRPPAVIVVEGEAGVGKSRLVTELLEHPDLSGRRHLVGRCHQIREPFPLGVIVEAVRRLGDDLRAYRLGPVAGALRPLLPEVADLLPLPPEPLDDRAAEQHRVFRGLVEVFTALGPGVLVLEDLHFADPKTVDFLAYLLAEPPPRLALVLTFRS
jgi:predicted ATPase